MSFDSPPVIWGGIVFGALVGLYLVIHLVRWLRKPAILVGTIEQVLPHGSVTIRIPFKADVKLDDQFSICKHLAVHNVQASTGTTSKLKSSLVVVGRARVLSVVPGQAACRFSALAGFSCNPSAGDVAILTKAKLTKPLLRAIALQELRERR